MRRQYNKLRPVYRPLLLPFAQASRRKMGGPCAHARGTLLRDDIMLLAYSTLPTIAFVNTAFGYWETSRRRELDRHLRADH